MMIVAAGMASGASVLAVSLITTGMAGVSPIAKPLGQNSEEIGKEVFRGVGALYILKQRLPLVTI
ncbi:MAG: hypothetical protein AAGL10_10245 [Pseudomonadota bacterium]